MIIHETEHCMGRRNSEDTRGDPGMLGNISDNHSRDDNKHKLL